MLALPAGYRQRCNQVRTALDAVRANHLPIWYDLADYILPMRTRFLMSDKNRGDRRSLKIVDSSPVQSVRTLKAGMMSGITSPARPWFDLTTPDPDLADFGPVKDYLYIVAQRLRDMLLKSNLYAKLPLVYQDMGVFGTACLTCEEDTEDQLRFRHLPLGTYWISTDEREAVDTLIRETTMTARQLVRRFTIEKVSQQTRALIDSGNGESEVQVIQHIARNEDVKPGQHGQEGMGWMAVWYETAAPDTEILGVDGFNEFPGFCPRWETSGDDVWGFGPGLEALGDVKALMAYETKQAKGLDKEIDPPLMGPASMRQAKVSLLPGDVTWLPDAAMQAGGLKPIHQNQFRIDLAEAKSAQIRQRISRAFFEDLFLMLANSDRRQITAREIEERHQEKLLALGPVLEGLNDELLDPLIDRTYAIANRRGLLPPPPEELQGVELKVEYTSVMAAAQRSVNLGTTRAFLGFVADAAKIAGPSVLDKVNIDEAIDEVGDQLLVNPRLIVPTDEANQRRAARAQAQQQAAQLQAAQVQTTMAKDLAAIPADEDNALARLTQGTAA
jgi:hypothetical protein